MRPSHRQACRRPPRSNRPLGTGFDRNVACLAVVDDKQLGDASKTNDGLDRHDCTFVGPFGDYRCFDKAAGSQRRSSFGIATSTWKVRLSASTEGLIHVTVPLKTWPGCEATVKRTSWPTVA